MSKKLKTKCWNLFSKYIRLRDANKKGICKCCTCGIKKPWKEMQAGHFVSGRSNSILFDDRGVHAQCKSCNLFNHGKPLEYFLFMEKTQGRHVIDELMWLKTQPRKISDEKYEQMIEDLQDKLVGLDMKRGEL